MAEAQKIIEEVQEVSRVDELLGQLRRSEADRALAAEEHAREKDELVRRMRKLEEMVANISVAPLETSSQAQSNDTTQHQRVPASAAGVPSHSNPATENIRIPVSSDEINKQISVQVEHIIRGDRDISQHRLRSFSGNRPKNGEVSFEEWTKLVEILLDDDSLSEKSKRQRILSSLHSPAADLARSMGDISSRELFARLEGLYGSTSNGVKLLQQFFSFHMEPTESASDYLQRLSVKLGSVQRKGGIQADQVDETILTHFKSTCTDDRICHVVHVKFDSRSPPSLQELMREGKSVEEDFSRKSTNRRDQQVPRQKISHHVQNVAATNEVDGSIRQLRDEMKAWRGEVDAMLHSISAAKNSKVKEEAVAKPRATQSDSGAHSNSHPFKRFCYNCGRTDGHYQQQCRNSANMPLVHKLLNERTAFYEKRGYRGNLNFRGSQQ